MCGLELFFPSSSYELPLLKSWVYLPLGFFYHIEAFKFIHHSVCVCVVSPSQKLQCTMHWFCWLKGTVPSIAMITCHFYKIWPPQCHNRTSKKRSMCYLRKKKYLTPLKPKLMKVTLSSKALLNPFWAPVVKVKGPMVLLHSDLGGTCSFSRTLWELDYA